MIWVTARKIAKQDVYGTETIRHSELLILKEFWRHAGWGWALQEAGPGEGPACELQLPELPPADPDVERRGERNLQAVLRIRIRKIRNQ